MNKYVKYLMVALTTIFITCLMIITVMLTYNLIKYGL
jgi:hypothetical protein